MWSENAVLAFLLCPIAPTSSVHLCYAEPGDQGAAGPWKVRAKLEYATAALTVVDKHTEHSFRCNMVREERPILIKYYR